MRVIPALTLIAALGLSAPAPAQEAADTGEGKGTAADGQMEMSLKEAWQNAKSDWKALQKASGDAWEKAKAEFDESWSALKRRLDEAEPATADDEPAGTD